MRATLTKRRASGGGGLTFYTQTNWARPAFTPARTVNFSDKTGLDSAIAGMQAGDLIQYNGTGVLSISSTTAYGYKIQNCNPTSTVVIDFGAPASTGNTNWGVTTTSNYVAFSTTNSSGACALLVGNCSNLTIYGGDYSGGEALAGVQVWAPISNVRWWDGYIHNVAGSGLSANPVTVGGATSSITNFNFRGEVNRFAMDPSKDPHADKGTGSHGAILHSDSGDFDNNTITVYAHDPLKPGETYNGTVWPEGGGGSAIEPGESPKTGSTGSYNNNTYYALGVNLLMTPNGTNPGSTGTQTAGNVIDAYGSLAQNGAVFGWIEGNNCTGAVFHGASGNWHNATPAVTVLHGRHTNTNQYVGTGGNISEPYDSRWGVVYNDCT